MMNESAAEDIAPGPGRPEAAPPRRMLSNYFLQLLNQLIRLCESILLVPLCLSAWGPDAFRDWVVLFSVMMFVGICDFGTITYFGNRFLALTATGDRERFRRELRIGLSCTLTLGIGILVVAYGLLYGYDSLGLFRPMAMSKTAVYASLVMMTLPISIQFSEEMLRTLYRANGEFGRGEAAFALFAIAWLIGFAIVLVLKLPPVAAAALRLVLPALMAVAVIFDVTHRYPGIVLRFAMPTLAELRHLAPQALLLFTAPLSLAIVQSGPVMMFAVMGLSSIPVLSYTLVRTVTGLARQAAFQFAVGTGIEMARHEARDERDACRRLYGATGAIVTGLVGLFSGFILWAATPFLASWTHGTVPADMPLVLAFLGGLLFAAPGQAGLMLLTYRNHAKPLAVAWGSFALGGMVLAGVLVPQFGVAAAAFSFGLSESIAVGLLVPFVIQRQFGFSAVQHITRSLATGILAFAWSAVIARLVFDLNLTGLKGLFLAGVLWAPLAFPPVILVLLQPRQRRMLFARLWRFGTRAA